MRFCTMKLLALVLSLLMLLGMTGVAEDTLLTGNAVVIDDDLISDASISDEGILLPDVDFDDYLLNPDPDTIDTFYEESEEPNEPTEGSEANSKAIQLGVNETYKIDTKELGKNLTFKSSKPKIASVSKKGVVKGVKKGTAVITVMSGTKVKAKLGFKVMSAPKKVTLNKTRLTLALYDEIQLKAKLPSGTASNKLIWKSSDEDVVTVFDDGWLFADDLGTATITVRTYNGKKATCKVKVVEKKPEPTSTPTQEPTPTPTPKSTSTPTPKPTSTPTPHGTETGELIRFYGQSIDYLQSVIADPLTEYETTASNGYFVVFFDKATRIIYGMRLESGFNKYSLLGVYPGMKYQDAHATLMGYGYRHIGGDNLNLIYRGSQLYSGTQVILKRSYSTADGGIILSIEFAKSNE